jgi:hypothetical protein
MERTIVADFKALSYIPPGGRDSLVGKATRYRLDGPGGGGGRARFSAPVQTIPEPKQPPLQWAPALFPEDKAAGAWR